MLNQSSIVSLVIVNYNDRGYLRPCLCSIQCQSYLPLEVIIVDNASLDGSIEMVINDFPEVILIKNKENLYFASAYNQGIRIAKGEFVLCLNNDIILDNNFIKNIIEQKDIGLGVGMWAGKIMRMDKETIDTTGLFLGKNRKPIERGYGQKDKGQFDKNGYVFGVGGAVVLFKKEMLEVIKIDNEYFDQDFKMFYEDLDLCWRANRFGWKAYYAANAIAYHKRGGTARTNTPKFRFFRKFSLAYLTPELQANLVKNRYLTIIKNDSLKDVMKNFIFIIGYDIMLWGYVLFFNPKIIFYLYKMKNSFKDAFKKRRIIFEKLKLGRTK